MGEAPREVEQPALGGALFGAFLAGSAQVAASMACWMVELWYQLSSGLGRGADPLSTAVHRYLTPMVFSSNWFVAFGVVTLSGAVVGFVVGDRRAKAKRADEAECADGDE